MVRTLGNLCSSRKFDQIKKKHLHLCQLLYIWIWHKLPDILLGHGLAVNSVTWNLAKCCMMPSASSEHMVPKWWLAESAITLILVASPEFFSLEQLYGYKCAMLLILSILSDTPNDNKSELNVLDVLYRA